MADTRQTSVRSACSTDSRSTCRLAIAALIGAMLSMQAFAQSEAGGLSPVEIGATAQMPDAQRAGVGAMSIAPLSETPQSITVIRAEQMRDAGARNVSDAMRIESSTTDFYNTTGYIESFQVRGFVLDETRNYSRDGLAISNHAPIPLENRERIELLKGISGIQAGSAAPGGLIDYVLKRPTPTPLRLFGFGLSERGTSKAYADLGGRLAQGQFGYRINLAAEALRPDIEAADGQRRFLSGFFDLRLPRDIKLEAEFEHHRFRQPSVPGFGLFDVDGDGVAETLPAPVDPSLNLNSQTWSQPFESRSNVGSLRLSQPFAGNWLWRLRWQRQTIRTNDRIAFPDGCSSGANYLYPGFCGNGDFDLYDFRSDGERRQFDAADAHVLGELRSGVVTHELKLGITSNRYRERYAPAQAYNWVGVGNMFAPVALPPDASLTTPNTDADARSTEFYLQDAMRMGERWSAWAGIRHSRIARSSLRTDGTEGVSLEQSFTTPWAAIGYKPWDGGFVYVSVGDGIETESVPNQPQAFVNYGQALAASRSRQYELGWRQKTRGNGLFSATLFRIVKPFAGDIMQADGRALRVAAGREARHQGLELAWAGRMSSRLDAQLRASWLDARIVRSLDATQIDKRTPNTAPLALATRLGWKLPGIDAVTWNNQLRYSARKTVTADGTIALPAYAQFDTDLVYRARIGASNTAWRLGIDNVFDRRYWRDAPTQYWGGVYLFPARARTFRVSVEAAF